MSLATLRSPRVLAVLGALVVILPLLAVVLEETTATLAETLVVTQEETPEETLEATTATLLLPRLPCTYTLPQLTFPMLLLLNIRVTLLSRPGGVFITTPAGSQPTQTSAAAANPPPAATTQPSDPAQTTPASSAAPPTSGGSDGGSGYSAGTACTQDGQWNCIGGKQFQRCASGTWSPAMALAAGTSCSPGLSMNMAIN